MVTMSLEDFFKELSAAKTGTGDLVPPSVPILTSETNPIGLSTEHRQFSARSTTVTAADIRAWCAMNDVNYQTVTNKIADCKVGH